MSPGVPFVDLDRIHAPLRTEFQRAFEETMSRADFTLGESVGRFELAFADYVGAEYAVGINSGTAAVTIAISAAGIGRGDEVIVPAHTYIASALGVMHAGAAPVLCDVDPRNGLIDLESAAATTGPRTAAILPVHLYGQACDMDALEGFAAARGLAVIEDAAQAHGARWGGRRTGSFGRAAAFSFYPSKNLGAFGDAGIVCTSDAALAERARRLGNIGQLSKGDHELAGWNERLHTLQAAVLEVKLPHLDEWNQSRAEAAAIYRELLPEAAASLPARAGSEDVHYLLPVRVDNRDAVAAALSERGIGTGIHFAPAVHRQPPLTSARRPVPLGRADDWAVEELSLPMFAGIRKDEIEQVCDALEESLKAADVRLAERSTA